MFLRRKWRDFRFWEPFWGIFGDLGVQTRRFFSFFVVTSPLRWGVGVLGATTHLLNVTVQRTAHFVRRTLEPIVRHFMVHDGILGSRHP